jgi:hypothetical protein
MAVPGEGGAFRTVAARASAQDLVYRSQQAVWIERLHDPAGGSGSASFLFLLGA